MAQKQPPKAPLSAGERARNYLLYGFGLSILLHLMLGPLIKFNRTQTEETKITKVKISTAPTPPPPTPTPKPTPPPTPTPPPKQTPPPPKTTPEPQVQKRKVDTIKTNSNNKSGPSEHSNTLTTGSTDKGVPQGNTTSAAPATAAATNPPVPPTPPPTPTPSPRPACAVPNAEPAVVNAYPPETPPIAQQSGITGTVEVRVELNASNQIVGTPTAVSGPSVLRAAAISATRQSSFKTEIRNCAPQPATYKYLVEFTNS